MKQRHCNNCSDRIGTECHHPQAVHMWGRLSGMQNVLPDKGWPRWPVADDWCGYWKPTQDWFLAKLADDIALCESVEELADIAESNAGTIARLPAAQKKRAAEMLKDAAQ